MDTAQDTVSSAQEPRQGLSPIKQAICQRIAQGSTVRELEKDPSFPARNTIFNWRNLDPDFDCAITRAYQCAGSALADEAIDLARNCTKDTWASARVAVDTLKWAASKFYPKVFGEQQPRSLHQTYVAGDVTLVADEGKRQAMIEARAKFLGDKDNDAPDGK